MLPLAQQHFLRTKHLASQIDKTKLAEWLLNNGYYPEQYVLPPCFHVESYDFKDKPYYTVKSRKKGTRNFNPTTSELENVFFPKSRLTDRVFGIIEPKNLISF